jgi:hypothetical protein
LSENSIFDGRNSFPTLINVELRDLLKRAFPYKLEFEAFTRDVYDRQLELIVEMVSCDKEVDEEFSREIELDLVRARRCAALNEDHE